MDAAREKRECQQLKKLDRPTETSDLKVGADLDAKDRRGGWYSARIAKLVNDRVLIHFIGFSKRQDEWFRLPESLDRLVLRETPVVSREEVEQRKLKQKDETKTRREVRFSVDSCPMHYI